tara:strand:+ start:822 stop:2093 length:1272 start_codon:yes stop_codon:yes gene_type:complete
MKYLTAYLFLLTMLFSTACSEDSSDGSTEEATSSLQNDNSGNDDVVDIGDGPGGTSGGDGTGGGEVVDDGSGNNITVDVDYKQAVDEANIGLPIDPTTLIRTTRIEIPLEFNETQILSAVTATATISNFAPNVHNSYSIAAPNLVVQDSAGNNHPIVFYFFPYKETNTKLSFDVYVTLNNKAYNALSYNQSHTAYYLRGPVTPGTPAVEHQSSEKWGFSNSNELNEIPTWKPGGIAVDSSANELSITPSYTKHPCYSAYSGTDCDTLASNATNLMYDKLKLQPIATVGYQDYNWLTYEFKTPGLSTAPGDSGIIENPTEAQKQAATAETLDELKANVSSGAKDIGWRGLDVSVRNQIIRYHGTEVQFSWKNVTNNPDDHIRIPENSIKISHATEGVTNDSPTPVAITHAAIDAVLEVQNVSED